MCRAPLETSRRSTWLFALRKLFILHLDGSMHDLLLEVLPLSVAQFFVQDWRLSPGWPLAIARMLALTWFGDQ